MACIISRPIFTSATNSVFHSALPTSVSFFSPFLSCPVLVLSSPCYFFRNLRNHSFPLPEFYLFLLYRPSKKYRITKRCKIFFIVSTQNKFTVKSIAFFSRSGKFKLMNRNGGGEELERSRANEWRTHCNGTRRPFTGRWLSSPGASSLCPHPRVLTFHTRPPWQIEDRWDNGSSRIYAYSHCPV